MTAIDATVVCKPLSGVHYAVSNQVQALLARYGDQEPICFAGDCDLAGALTRYPDVGAHVDNSLTTVSRRIFWQQYRLPKLLRRYHCDRLLAMAYTAPRRCTVPYAVQIHDVIALRRPELCTARNAWHMRFLMPRSIRAAEWVMTSAAPVADEIVTLTGVERHRVHVVPLGVDNIFLQDPCPESLRPEWRELEPYLLFVGNFEPKKGIDKLLDAYEIIAARTGLNLVLAGRDGWKCKNLANRISRHTGPGKIVRLGYVERRQLPALYEHARLFVLPSVEEGFGLPVLEAMARGTVTIHSDHPVLQRTSHGFGVTFPVGDAAALAQTIERTLNDPDKTVEFATAARDYACAQTWDRWAVRTAEATGYF
ncbi:MAG: glycosyltransferase family 1 protein [Lentisphaeria bacterium]|jgi:glycosyltransferase involved in cell wall biosynthesis|nr:glycosyltransferase family 1 protein [Lentisphaeria bacterium]MDP7740814.1 glycosyltransferase family 1 protein [Lentisphaeria bacterium]